MRKSRGLTFLEVLVAAGLSLLLLTYTAQLLLQLGRNSLRAEVSAGLQQQVTVTLTRLISDLQSTTPAGLTWQPDLGPNHLRALAVQPLLDVDGDGLPVYADNRLTLYVYDRSARLLRRRQWLPAQPPPVALQVSQPLRLSDVQLLDCLNTPLFSQDASIRNIYQFDLANPYPAPNLGNPLDLRLAASQQAVSSHEEYFELRRTIVLRNPK